MKVRYEFEKVLYLPKKIVFLESYYIIPIPQNKVQYNQLKNIIESYAEKNP